MDADRFLGFVGEWGFAVMVAISLAFWIAGMIRDQWRSTFR